MWCDLQVGCVPFFTPRLCWKVLAGMRTYTIRGTSNPSLPCWLWGVKQNSQMKEISSCLFRYLWHSKEQRCTLQMDHIHFCDPWAMLGLFSLFELVCLAPIAHWSPREACVIFICSQTQFTLKRKGKREWKRNGSLGAHCVIGFQCLGHLITTPFKLRVLFFF